ncbi:MAG: hypothetical protein J0I06_25355 [Planctomycetes bacterium]|nr:hypothetical protein [Planctomycetota bacterium]
MNRIVADADLVARLRGTTKSVEIADESGNVIGTFVPNEAYERIMSFLLPEPTKEELAEARAEMLAGGGVRAEELRARLAEIRRRREARQ